MGVEDFEGEGQDQEEGMTEDEREEWRKWFDEYMTRNPGDRRFANFEAFIAQIQPWVQDENRSFVDHMDSEIHRVVYINKEEDESSQE